MKTRFAGNIANQFIKSKLSPLLMIVFLLIGVYSAWLTPREEEPQIDVPIADIFVRYPGANPTEVESRISKPLEKIVSNIPGVEYVYSTSMKGQAMVIVQFLVGEDVERSLVKMYNEIVKHMDEMPKGISFPLIKTRAIDDVPILSLTFWSETHNDFQIRTIAEEVSNEIKKINSVSATNLIGGRKRKINIVLDKEKMSVYKVDPTIVAGAIKSANSQMYSGDFNSNDNSIVVKTGNFLSSAEEIKNIIVNVIDNVPVYLKQIAEITDGPEIPENYVSMSFGKAAEKENKTFTGSYPAVTLSIAKQRGTDAMKLSDKILNKIETLKKESIPAGVEISVTRNYGETASEKVSELIMHLLGAIIAVTIVVMLSMGWRGGLVVFLSVPVTFALTMFAYYFMDYTLNRITLFALVFVTGIVVDDSIIVAENIHRHFKMKKLPFLQAALRAIDEVGNPTILATFTVIAAVLPMAFVSGLMGPYMSPMPIGASIAMIFSLIVALTITPYLAYKLLKFDKHESTKKKNFVLESTIIYKAYKWIMQPMLDSSRKSWIFIGSITFVLLITMSLFYFKSVTVKILPFDNKNEFQVIIDMPEGTTLERTAVVTKEIEAVLSENKYIKNFQSYVGTSAPINFNGLVRHYDIRRGNNVADIQVNLIHKSERSLQSHDIAKMVRPEIQKVAKIYNANAKVVEVPPGPPVLSTLVAEVYGPNDSVRVNIANQLKDIFSSTPNVVDVDWYVEDDHDEFNFVVDKNKATLSGLSTGQIVQNMHIALRGQNVSQLYSPESYEQIGINLQLKEESRSDIESLKKLNLVSARGNTVSVGDLVEINKVKSAQSIYRKNQKRAVYVTADIAGDLESPVYAILEISQKLNSIKLPKGYSLEEHYKQQPFLENNYGIKWDGEWQITYEVFRDLGTAFAVVLVIIYMLIIGWFQNFKVPFVMMLAIPLSLIGIILGHWMLGAFFTATSMIGLIALAGIMVRNSVLLIDFINLRLKDGVDIKTAVIEAGAIRTTPILLTAGTVVIGAVVILFDPIFQGLAISLMGGTIASTFLTLIMVPLIYYMVEKRKKVNK